MAFSFTSDKIGEEIIRQFKNGVKVYGIFEKIGSNTKYSEYTKMKLEKIPVKLDKNRYRMHHKVIVIDGQIVVMGSYNFSESANNQNDENILIIDNNEIAAEYLQEFNRLYY
jgi:phosphatidylserine/phosphatidylglycerophosphate/cardiolipin synthase-like enzyme